MGEGSHIVIGDSWRKQLYFLSMTEDWWRWWWWWWWWLEEGTYSLMSTPDHSQGLVVHKCTTFWQQTFTLKVYWPSGCSQMQITHDLTWCQKWSGIYEFCARRLLQKCYHVLNDIQFSFQQYTMSLSKCTHASSLWTTCATLNLLQIAKL
jgi:hypothetical protein